MTLLWFCLCFTCKRFFAPGEQMNIWIKVTHLKSAKESLKVSLYLALMLNSRVSCGFSKNGDKFFKSTAHFQTRFCLKLSCPSKSRSRCNDGQSRSCYSQVVMERLEMSFLKFYPPRLSVILIIAVFHARLLNKVVLLLL